MQLGGDSSTISRQASRWRSGFIDHLKQKLDWLTDHEESPKARSPLTTVQETASQASTATENLRAHRTAVVVRHLRIHHECANDKWRRVRGKHRCEECFYWLHEYIIACRQCSLQVCNRCSRIRYWSCSFGG